MQVRRVGRDSTHEAFLRGGTPQLRLHPLLPRALGRIAAESLVRQPFGCYPVRVGAPMLGAQPSIPEECTVVATHQHPAVGARADSEGAAIAGR